MILFLEEHSMRKKTCGDRIRVEEMHKYIADELILASCAPFLCPTLERWGVKKAKEQEKAYAIA